MMTHGSLFSGIGGFDLAAEWMGWNNVFHCEYADFPRKVLNYYWPNADSHVNICDTNFTKYANTIDVISGGFPCQPFSSSGTRKGTNDERYLWPEMLRAICEIKPKYIIAENVFGITNIDGGLVFEQICIDLENQGYQVQSFIIPANAKNAPHRRDRLWIIAHTTSNQYRKQQKQDQKWQDLQFRNNDEIWNVTDTNSIGRYKNNRDGKPTIINKNHANYTWEQFPITSPICSRNDGLSNKLHGITFSKWRKQSLMAYGNAIVPQIAYTLFSIIQDHYNKFNQHKNDK